MNWPLLGIVFALGFLVCNTIHIIWGEEYKFNYTKELQNEERILQLCIVDTKITLPDVAEFCSTRYGGLNTTYGDKIK